MCKGKIWCNTCDSINGNGLTDFEFSSLHDLPSKCPSCNGEDIFFQQLDFGEDTNNNRVKTGNGGCGGYRR